MFITVFTVIIQLIIKFKRTGHFFLQRSRSIESEFRSLPAKKLTLWDHAFFVGVSQLRKIQKHIKIENSWHSEIRLIIRVFQFDL